MSDNFQKKNSMTFEDNTNNGSPVVTGEGAQRHCLCKGRWTKLGVFQHSTHVCVSVQIDF